MYIKTIRWVIKKGFKKNKIFLLTIHAQKVSSGQWHHALDNRQTTEKMYENTLVEQKKFGGKEFDNS